MFRFNIIKKLGEARLSELTTPHGLLRGPFFQFVATQGAIRGMVFSEDLEKLDVAILLANTYHLHLRPGADTVAKAGGLHSFMQWNKPVTTDSGGYQVFSLGESVQLDHDGVTFRSPFDGSAHRLTPEMAIQIQHKLGADITMPLDVCTPYGASHDEVAAAVAQTTDWAKRCKEEHEQLQPNSARDGFPSDAGAAPGAPTPDAAAAKSKPSGGDARLAKASGEARAGAAGPATVLHPARARSQVDRQALYGIVQGSIYPDLREQSAASVRELDFFGYSIGGEVRDSKTSEMEAGVKMTAPHLPADKPRYLMGAGAPEDIIRAVRAGIDQFDCVLPIRNARHGKMYTKLREEEVAACLRDPERPVDPATLYTSRDIRQRAWAADFSVFSPGNPAIPKDYTTAYVHHLLRVEPPSGLRLMVLHNIHFYVQLFRSIQAAIDKDSV